MDAQHLLVSDLDGTLLGDDAALDGFDRWLAARRAAWRLAYATGRTFESVADLVASGRLPPPDAVISNVGTEIHDPAGMPWQGWPERHDGWEVEKVHACLATIPDVTPQPAESQTPRKASYYATDLSDEALDDIRRVLRRAGIAATVAYSSARDLDVLPADTGKGRTARLLARCWDIEVDRVIVCGDSGNDLQLLTSGFRGVVVANAQPELLGLSGADIFRSTLSHAAGVIDGIRHWTGEASRPDRPNNLAVSTAGPARGC